jgi:hypothetical protein
VETGTESDRTPLWVDLNVSEDRVGVGRDDDVDGLDGSAEGLVKILLGDLELEQSTIDLVDNDDGLDTLGQGLTENGLGLDTDTLDTVNDDKGTIGDTESGSDLGREINVTRGIDQVDQELVTIGLLGDISDILLDQLKVHGNGGTLDGNTTLLFIITSIGESHVTSLGTSDNTGLGDEGIGQGGFTVIDVGDNGHVTDVGGSVHETTHLVDGEVNHLGQRTIIKESLKRVRCRWFEDILFCSDAECLEDETSERGTEG